MTHLQITHIYKDDRLDPTTAILWIGGINATGFRWRMEMRTAAELVRRGQASFFTHEKGRYAVVEAVVGPSGLYYLRTDPDTIGANNLLNLPELDATFTAIATPARASGLQSFGFEPAAGLLGKIAPETPAQGLLSSSSTIRAAGFQPEGLRGGLLNLQSAPKR